MSSVKVAVRVRPFNQREIDLNCKNVICMEGKKTTICNQKCSKGEEESKEFTFDYSYWSFNKDDKDFVSQEIVFKDLGENIVSDAIEGYNSCIFAYGQTGSGKTHTMMGSTNSAGLIPRICERLFEKIQSIENNNVSYKTEISYLEIYNEQVRDLLDDNFPDANGNTRKSLKIREHPKYGPYVEKLSKHLVYNYQDIYKLMEQGNINRTTASTNMNDTSSRSHAIFTISFSNASYVANNPYETVSKINLVDLAGSERANSTQATGQRLVEGSHINKSLVTLGNVISNLAEVTKKSNKKKSSFIPYRDSTLTWLLKDSLGGNSKTVMIATISPADVNYSETLNTLRYANRAKNIMNKPQINEDPNTKLIRELRTEIERLTLMVNQNPLVSEKVQENEAKVKELTQEWICKWDEIKKILTEQHFIAIRKSGNSGVVLDSDRPHLIVCADDDVLSTGVTLYQLNEGDTFIGTKFANKKQDIIINSGSDVEDEHCYIHWNTDNNTVTLYPINNSLCFINNSQVGISVDLHQGCFIVLGENNMFRFSNPLEVKNIKEKPQDSSAGDISKLNRTHLIGSTSYDSMYNSISSLNKKMMTSFTSAHDLNMEDIDEKYDQNIKFENGLQISRQNADFNIEKASADLEFIKDFLIEIKKNLKSDQGESLLEILLNSLVKIGNDEEISKEKILQVLTLLNNNINLKESNEVVINKVNEYLFEKLNELKIYFQNEKNLNCTNIDECGNKILSHGDSSSNVNPDFTNDSKENSYEFKNAINAQLFKLSNDVESQLELLNNCFSKLTSSQTDEDDYSSESENNLNYSGCINHTISNGSTTSILDELIEAEVKRRMEKHLLTCSFSTANTSNVHLSSTPNSRNQDSSKLAKHHLLFDSENVDDIIIYISSFHLQLQPDEHYEYEIKININQDKWTIFRRYRCFLQLHQYLQSKYGDKILLPYFPPKKWFNNKCVKVIELRRRFLENYLQNVIELCKDLPECPLNYRFNGLEHLDRFCLYNFSDFFKLNTLVDNENWW